MRGPLNVARSPQGRPVLVQAGASGTGRDVAARLAELVFTAQTTFEQAKEFYADVMARLPKFGRTPDQVKVMPGFYPVVAPTESEAQGEVRLPAVADPAQRRALDPRIHDRREGPRQVPARRAGAGNGRHQRPAQPPAPAAGGRRGATSSPLWELCLLNAGPRGHALVIGTPEHVADVMEHWFLNGAADGFNVMPAWLPGSLDDFVDLVIPELQRRGLFRTEYEAMTLRENLGLPMPVSRFHAAACDRGRTMSGRGPVLASPPGRRPGGRRRLPSAPCRRCAFRPPVPPTPRPS